MTDKNVGRAGVIRGVLCRSGPPWPPVFAVNILRKTSGHRGPYKSTIPGAFLGAETIAPDPIFLDLVTDDPFRTVEKLCRLGAVSA